MWNRRILCLFLLSLLTGMLCMWSCSETPETPNDGGGFETAAEKAEQCRLASDCKDCSQKCTQNACVEIQCKNSDDCRCGWKCVKGKCYNPDLAPCQTNTDCKANPKLWKCEKGECIDGGCRSDGDCNLNPKKNYCNLAKHQCEKRPCKQNSDCPDESKPICNKSGDCVVDNGAEEGEDCSQKTCKLEFTCYEKGGKKLCRRPCNPFASKCKASTICLRHGVSFTRGLCLAPGQGLKDGEDCSGGKTCQEHLRCAFTGGKENCRRPCLTDDHCPSNKERCQTYLKEKLCLPLPEPCGPGRSCTGEQEKWEQCQAGNCKLLLCPSQYKCPPTHKCQKNGRCIPKLCPRDACGSLYECKNERCVRTNEGLRCGDQQPIDAQSCGPKLSCASVGYILACVRTCSNDKCPDGFTCVTNKEDKKICVQACPAKCNYPDHFCYSMKRKPSGKFCVPTGQPSGKDLLETCSNQNPCLPDLRCYTGFSSKSGYCTLPCTSQSDCGNVTNATCVDILDGKHCYHKCAKQSFGNCTVNNAVQGYCTRGSRIPIYICRPR